MLIFPFGVILLAGWITGMGSSPACFDLRDGNKDFLFIAGISNRTDMHCYHNPGSPEDSLIIYKNPFYPPEQRIDDLLSRMTLEEKVGQMNMPCVYKQRIGWGMDVGTVSLHRILTPEERAKQMEGCRKFARGNHNDQIGPGGGFFTLADRIIYEGTQKQSEFFNELQKIATEETRLGIPLLQIEEGTHGFMCAGGTVFPEGLAIASSWNMDLVHNIYEAIAREGRATGVHMLCTIVIEPNRDPRMGRNQEGYSEDPYMCSRIAENIVRAMQGYDISAKDKAVTVFTAYPGQTEPVSGLERGAIEISGRKLREVFLPPWVSGIKNQGALGVMAMYPAIDNVVTHSSEKLLKKILREEMGFEGIVLSEGMGISTIISEGMAATQKEAGQIAVMAGVDVGISMEDAYLGSLVESVKEGKVPVSAIDDAVRHILNVKFKLGLFESPYVDPEYAVRVVHCKEHVELALQAAREGIVLLKNKNGILPLKKNINSIAVIGPNADAAIDQLGDYIPHNIPQDIVTVLEGIRNKVASGTKVTYVKGCNVIGDALNEIDKAVNAAQNADIAIVVIGEAGNETNGEGRDVASLDLTGLQEELLKAVNATSTPTIVVLINGRPLSIRWTAENSPAIVEAWMCGEQGGNAVAEVIFGDYNPSGRLPISVPRHSGQLPVYYNHSKTRGRRYIDMPATPLYAFGHGLSYTTFEYTNLQIRPLEINTGGEIDIILDVKNTGDFKGEEVVQLYIRDILSSVTTPGKELKGFEKIALEPGEKKTVAFKLLPEDLSLLDPDMHEIVEPGTFQVMAGSSSRDIHLKGEFVVK
jgi:beta-glucosidase